MNEAIAETSRQQTLINIVRVYHDESPVILNVAETDDASQFGASANGGLANIGAIAGTSGGTLAGRTGTASATAVATDSITNRYVPLQGQELSTQLSSPITADTIYALYESNWPLYSIIELSIDQLTPHVNDFTKAEDLVTQLDAESALSFASTKSAFSKEKPGNIKAGGSQQITIQTQTPPLGAADSLNLYFDSRVSQKVIDRRSGFDNDLWRELSELYASTQPDQKGKLLSASRHLSNLIELRLTPRTNLEDIDPKELISGYLGPVIRTRTAVGILKYITSQPKVSFVSKNEYDTIRKFKWNSDEYHTKCPNSDVYVLSPSDDAGYRRDEPGFYIHIGEKLKEFPDKAKHISDFLNEIVEDRYNKYMPRDIHACVFSYPHIVKEEKSIEGVEDEISELKRLMLVVRSSDALADTFASWFSEGQYYSIMNEDIISRRNLMLLSQLLTIQSTSTPSPSITAISASGH